MDAYGKVKHGLRWIAKDLTETLKRDLERYNLYEGETPHSFRHGGTVDSLKRGKSLEQTMYLAYMKNQKTAEMYSRGLKALFPKGFDWKDRNFKVLGKMPIVMVVLGSKILPEILGGSKRSLKKIYIYIYIFIYLFIYWVPIP